MTNDARAALLCAAIDTIILNAPEVAVEGGRLKRVVRQNPNNRLIERRLGILCNNAMGSGENTFSESAKRQIGEAMILASGGDAPGYGDGLSERFEMKLSPEQKSWVMDNGGAAKVRELIDKARGE